MLKLLLFLAIISVNLYSQYDVARIRSPYLNEYKELEKGPNDVLWVGTWGDGIKRSNDKAVTWVTKNNGLGDMYISDINYKSGILLAGTYGGGVFKSVDEGDNWVAINNGLFNSKVVGVAVKDADTYFAATEGNGVFRTTDAGATWEEKNVGNNFQDMRFIHITPAGNILAGKQGEGVIRSDDNGDSWQYSQSGIFNKYVVSIQNLPNDEIWISSAGEGIFQSSDDGNHWLRIELLDNLIELNIESFTYFEHENEYYQIIATRNWGIWRFDPQWNAPRFLTTQYVDRTAHSMVTLSTGRIVVALGSQGISYTDDDGVFFNNVKELREGNYNDYEVFADGNNVLVGLGTKGIYHSNDYGYAWEDRGEQHEEYGIFEKQNNRFYYSATNILKYTTNNGVNWTPVAVTDLMPNATDYEKQYKYTGIVHSGNNLFLSFNIFYLYTGTSAPPPEPPTVEYGILQSTDNGVTWNLDTDIKSSTHLIGLTKTSNGNLYTVSELGEVFISTNSGVNWTQSSATLNSENSAFNFIKSNGNRVYIAGNKFLEESIDNGLTFNRVNFKFDEMEFKGFTPRENAQDMVFTGPNRYFTGFWKNLGVYETKDNGINFDSLNNSYPTERVRSMASNSDGDVYIATSSVWRYVDAKGLPKPTLVSPSDRATNVSISSENTEGRIPAVITWEDTDKADMYEIQVSEFEQFYNFMYKKVHAGTSATLTDSLKYNTTYYWRVRSKINDSYGSWSSRWEFTTELPAPTLTYPADNQVGIPTTPVFKWDNVEGTENYIVEVSSSMDFQDVVFSNTVTASTFTSATLTSPVKLNTFSQYYWRAKAISSKSESRWSEYNSFVTVTGAPTLIFPENNASEVATELIFKFKGDINANRYQIQVSSDSTFKEVALLILNRETETDSTHYFDFLQFYKTYYWRVQSVQTIEDTSGTKNYFGEWSQVWKFTTGIKPPGLLSPPNNSFDVPLVTKLEWDSFDEAVGYHVQLSKDMSFTNGLIVNDTLADLSLDIADGLLSNYELYYWRMRVILADNAAAWVSPWRFTTVMERTSSVSPNCGDTDQPLTFTIVWKEVKGAEKYKIEISKTDKFDENDIVFSREDITKDRVLIDAGLEANNTYYWRTQGYNDNNVGEWSDVCTFSTVTLGIRNIEKDFNFVAFPNPTKDKMNYEFTLPKACKVKVEIFDMSGLQVSTLCDAYLNRGQQELSWDVSNLSNGTYNLIMTVNGQSYIKLVGVSK